MLEVKWFTGLVGIQDAYNVRYSVFVEEQNVPLELEQDEHDADACHLVIFYNNYPIATGRIVKPDRRYFLGRIAVIKEHRGKHLGELVVKELSKKVFSLGAEEVHIHAQKHVMDFYKKLGFKTYGDVFEEAGIEHVSMVLNSIRNELEVNNV